MKRVFIAAASFAALVPAAAVQIERPYEELDVERRLPEVQADRSRTGTQSPPQQPEPERVDRTPATGPAAEPRFAQSGEASAGGEGPRLAMRSPWSEDHHFIAPEQ